MVRRFSEEDVRRASGMPDPGWHDAYVAKCEALRSQAGRSYYRVHLHDPKSRAPLVQDVCMLQGAYYRIGLEKLVLLGGAIHYPDTGEWDLLDAGDVRGTRVRVCIRHGTYQSPNGERTRAEVDTTEGTHGYEAVVDDGEGGVVPF